MDDELFVVCGLFGPTRDPSFERLLVVFSVFSCVIAMFVVGRYDVMAGFGGRLTGAGLTGGAIASCI